MFQTARLTILMWRDVRAVKKDLYKKTIRERIARYFNRVKVLERPVSKQIIKYLVIAQHMPSVYKVVFVWILVSLK